MDQSAPQVTPQQPVAKPRLISLGDLLHQSFDLYQRLFQILIKLALINVAVSLGVLFFFGGIFLMLFKRNAFSSHSPEAFVIVGLIFAALGVAATIISLWISASSLFLLQEKDPGAGVKKTLAKGWTIIWSYAWVTFLAGLAIGIGFLLFVIPGIIFSTWFTFSVYVLIFEGKKGTQALKRSKELVKGYWWPVFGRLFLIFMLGLLVSRLPFIGFVLAILFVAPFTLVYNYLVYEDLRRIHSTGMWSSNTNLLEKRKNG